jgi:hypothetical protein
MSDWHLLPNFGFAPHEKSADCWCHPVQHIESHVWLHNEDEDNIHEWLDDFMTTWKAMGRGTA